MERVFVEKLEQELILHMGKVHPQFRYRPREGTGRPEWTVFDWRPSGTFHAAVGVRAVAGRNYAIPQVMWSKKKEISFALSPKKVRDKALEELESYKASDSICLSACEFGRLENSYPMGRKRPGLGFLEQKLNNPRAKEKLAEAGFEAWRDMLLIIDDWGMLVEVLGEEAFNKEDVEYGLGDLPQQLIELIDNHFIPYLHKVWESRT